MAMASSGLGDADPTLYHQPEILIRHGEARSAVAIQRPVRAPLDGHAPSGLAMTERSRRADLQGRRDYASRESRPPPLRLRRLALALQLVGGAGDLGLQVG